MSAVQHRWMPTASACALPAVSLELDPRAVYIAPSGRRCRLYQQSCGTPRTAFALLVYELKDGTAASPVNGDGFVLSASNFHLLSRVG